VIVSDFWGAEEWQPALATLEPAGYDPIWLQVLGPEDWEPPPGPGALLVDRETGEVFPRELGPAVRAAHGQALEQWVAGLSCAARRQRALFLRHRAPEPFEGAIIQLFRRGRFLP
jgi:hypothetical protein